MLNVKKMLTKMLKKETGTITTVQGTAEVSALERVGNVVTLCMVVNGVSVPTAWSTEFAKIPTSWCPSYNVSFSGSAGYANVNARVVSSTGQVQVRNTTAISSTTIRICVSWII